MTKRLFSIVAIVLVPGLLANSVSAYGGIGVSATRPLTLVSVTPTRPYPDTFRMFAAQALAGRVGTASGMGGAATALVYHAASDAGKYWPGDSALEFEDETTLIEDFTASAKGASSSPEKVVAAVAEEAPRSFDAFRDLDAYDPLPAEIIQEALSLLRRTPFEGREAPLNLLEQLAVEERIVSGRTPHGFRVEKTVRMDGSIAFYLAADSEIRDIFNAQGSTFLNAHPAARRAATAFVAAKLLHLADEILMESEVSWSLGEADPGLSDTQAAAYRLELRFLKQIPSFADALRPLLAPLGIRPDLWRRYERMLAVKNLNDHDRALTEWLESLGYPTRTHDPDHVRRLERHILSKRFVSLADLENGVYGHYPRRAIVLDQRGLAPQVDILRIKTADDLSPRRIIQAVWSKTEWLHGQFQDHDLIFEAIKKLGLRNLPHRGADAVYALLRNTRLLLSRHGAIQAYLTRDKKMGDLINMEVRPGNILGRGTELAVSELWAMTHAPGRFREICLQLIQPAMWKIYKELVPDLDQYGEPYGSAWLPLDVAAAAVARQEARVRNLLRRFPLAPAGRDTEGFRIGRAG